MKLFRKPQTLLLAVMALLLISCGESETPEEAKEVEEVKASGLLTHVPADTPYIFVNSRRSPRDVNEKMLKIAALSLDSAMSGLKLAKDEKDNSPLKLIYAMLGEFEGKLTPEGLESLGLPVDGQDLVYGLGLLPVMRVEISDQQKVRDFISRVEQRSGMKAPLTEQGGYSYRRFDLKEVAGIMAVTDNYLIAALLPAKLELEYLPMVLGDKKPEQNLADAGSFQQMLSDNGFTGYGEGYIDLARIVEIVLGESKGVNATVWNALETDGIKQSPACTTLVKELTNSVPRLLIGTTELTGQRIGIRSIFETSPAVSAHLQKLAAPVPGLGGANDAMISFGFGMNLPELRTAITSAIQAVQEQGKGCEWVKQDELTKSLQATNAMLNPMFAGIKGGYFKLNDLDLDEATMQPKMVDAQLMLATDDPRGIFGMVGMVSPQLAQLQLPNDGTAVQLPLEGVVPMQNVPPVYIAAKEKLLSLSIGERAEQSVTDAFNGKLATPAPILDISMDVGKYYTALGSIMENMTNQLNTGDEEAAEALRQQFAGMKEMGKYYERMSFQFIGTDKGLVIDQVIELK